MDLNKLDQTQPTTHEDVDQIEQVLERTSQMLVNAEVDNYTRQIFLKNMSHRVRTSMNSILGFVDLIFQSRLTGKQYRYLDLVKSSAYELLINLDDTIDLSRIEVDQYEIKNVTFNIRTLMETIVDLIYLQLHEKSIQLHLDIDNDVASYIVGDAERLIRTLINLVNKSHSVVSQSDIIISVSEAERSSNSTTLAFAITNSDGKAKKTHDINEFTVIEPINNKRFHPGHNIGVSIASCFINHLGGALLTRKLVNTGTDFYFTMQFPIPKDVHQNATETVSGLSKCKLLIIADNEINGNILLSILKPYFKTVEFKLSFKSAEFDKSKFDLIICDISNPSIVLKDLKDKCENSQREQAIPFLAIVDRDIPSLQYLREKPQVEILYKPCKWNQLFAGIKTSLKIGNYIISNPRKTKGKSKKRILLVEDVLVNQILAKTMLKDTGIIIDVAEDGEQALSAIKEKTYDLIFMDVQMPTMDGITATKIIRNEMGFVDIPIVAMTANVMNEDRDLCINAGMNDYIAKPIRNEELHEVLEKWLSKVEASAR